MFERLEPSLVAWALVLLVLAVAVGAGVGVGLHYWRFVAYHRFKGRELPRALGTALRREVAAFGTLGWWHLRAFLQDHLRMPEEVTGRPVLCVHGYSQNATNLHGIRRALERAGRPTVAVSLLWRLAPLRWYARRLERRLAVLAPRCPHGFDVVAHSMGGVVLRVVLAARPDLGQAVHTVVTLGSPHSGTAAARGLPLLPEILAMKRSSALLRSLPPLTALVPHARVVTIGGDADTIVYPVETTFVPGAEPIVLHGVGHSGLLTDRRAHQAVVQALGR